MTNDLTTDQRVHKVASSLHDFGYNVLSVGRLGSVLNTREYNCHRMNIVFKKSFLFYLEFNIKLFFFLLFQKKDLLLSNDLDTLLPNFLISKITNKPLIYDSHELFTEVPELLERPLVKSVWLFVERLCLPYVKFTYTVSHSIAQYYKDKYGVDMSVIKNYPKRKKINSIHNTSENKIIIYQGAINKDRGIELMISAMEFVEAQLYIIGSGDVMDMMKNHVKKLGLENKVYFFGKLSFDKLFKITQTADLGLSFEADTCLAYRYALPNKIFDYIQAEIPILVSDLPELRGVVNTYHVGEVLNSRDPRSVALQITNIIEHSKTKLFPEIPLAKQKFCWKFEEEKLFSLFRKTMF